LLVCMIGGCNAFWTLLFEHIPCWAIHVQLVLICTISL
jgi:hypothetical protein